MPEGTENTQQQPDATTQAVPPTGDATGTNGGEQQQVATAEKTYTQADIDRIIGEKLAKERAKQEQAVKKAQEDANRKAAEQQGQYEQLYKDAQAKLEAAELEAKALRLTGLQRQAADKVGLPAAFAERLRGDTLEDLEVDAKSLLASLPKPAAPNLNNEAGAGGKPNAQSGMYGGLTEQQFFAVYGVKPAQ